MEFIEGKIYWTIISPDKPNTEGHVGLYMYLGKAKYPLVEYKFLQIRSLLFWNDGYTHEEDSQGKFVYETKDAQDYFVPYKGKVSQSEITFALLEAN